MGGKNPGKGNCGIAFIEYVDSEMMCRCLSNAVASLNMANAHLELTLVAEEEKRNIIAIRNLMMDAIRAVDAAISHSQAFAEYLIVNLDELHDLKDGTIPSDVFDYNGFRQFVVNREEILDPDSFDRVSSLLASDGFVGFFTVHADAWNGAIAALSRLRDTFQLAYDIIPSDGGIGLASHDNRIPIRQDYTRAYNKVHRLAMDWTVFALVSTEIHLKLCGLPTIARFTKLAA